MERNAFELLVVICHISYLRLNLFFVCIFLSMILEQLVDFVELVLANDTFKLLLLLEESSLVLGLE